MPKTVVVLFVLILLAVFPISAADRPPAKTMDSPMSPTIMTIHIDMVHCPCLPQIYKPCIELSLHGTGFGATRGNQVVVIDGQPLTDPNAYYGWSNTGIACRGLQDPPDLGHNYKIEVGSISPKNRTLLTVLSNAVYYRYLIRWLENAPNQSGHPGDTIQEIACGVRPPQGNLVLMIGSTQVTNVVSWGTTEGYLVFQVPANAPAGTFELYIQAGKGGKIVSTKKQFTVQ